MTKHQPGRGVIPESRFSQAPSLPSDSGRDRPEIGTILLVNPFYPKDPHGSFAKHVLTPSLALTSIAAATPQSWEVSLWDENLLQGPPPANPVPEVVGITVHLTFARRGYEIASWYRRQGSIVVIGGPHATACPAEVQRHCDSVVIGEGVSVWPRVLRDIRLGRLRRRYAGSYRSPHFRALPTPRRSLLPKESFLTTASVIATRGCHNRCSFCLLSTKGTDMPYQVLPVESVVRQIEETDEPYVVFLDNNLGSDRQYLRQLCRQLEPLGIIWSGAVSLDITDDPSLVREMALSGCTGVFIGFESIDADNLQAAGKRSPHPRQFGWRIRLLQDHGIQVNGSFVLGFDHDRRGVFDELTEWIDRNRLECATFQILTPYPGTPLFHKLESEGRLLHCRWEFYDTAHAVFRPRHMEPEELESGYARCYQRVFSLESIWRRRPRKIGAAAAYLAMTYLYKRCNWLWAPLIGRRKVRTVWRPLILASKWRHLAGRAAIARKPVWMPPLAGCVGESGGPHE